MKKVYTAIRELRQTTSISGHDAAYIAGITFPTYYGLETKPVDPNSDTMLSVLAMLARITKRSPGNVFDHLFDETLDVTPVEVILNQDVLFRFRNDAGLSLRELAKRAGLSVGAVHAAELMPVNAQADSVLSILEVLSSELQQSSHRLLEQLV